MRRPDTSPQTWYSRLLLSARIASSATCVCLKQSVLQKTDVTKKESFCKENMSISKDIFDVIISISPRITSSGRTDCPLPSSQPVVEMSKLGNWGGSRKLQWKACVYSLHENIIDEREVDHEDLESKERSREANRAVGEV